MNARGRVQIFVLWVFLAGTAARGAEMEKTKPGDAAPSKTQVLWTATHWAYNFEGSYSYAAPSPARFGPGQEGDVSSYHSALSNIFTSRALMAFLFHAGLEWDRIGLHAPPSMPIPKSLHRIDAFLATDFRWSEKSMLRLQAVPGFYTDSNPIEPETFNVPWAIAYTRIPSKKFQWTLALSGNSWRKMPLAPGGGFRWQMSDRWKLKFLLPYPQIEYRAAKALHLWVGSELIGDSYRVSGRFGSEKGDPSLNHALVDYQEIHVGTGFSWNILPLLEFNMEAGYLLDREFNYHNNDLRSTSGKAPYGGVQLRYLFQISKDPRPMRQQMEEMGNDYPWMRRFIRLPR
jgi:hypothetical protein